MGGKRIKKLKKQMPISDGLRAQAYFHDMAARGLFLEEISHLYYYFREGEPTEIRYAAKVFPDYPLKGQLEEMEATGWKEVCHWDKEFVFATEDPSLEVLFDHLEEEWQDVERRITETEKEKKKVDWFPLLMILIVFGAGVYANGFKAESMLDAVKQVWHWMAILLFGIVFNFFYKRHLQRKKETLEEQRQLREEGRWDDRDMEWHGKRAKNTVRIGILVLLLAAAGYYGCNMNEEAFDMPVEVSYADLPAVRVEELQDGDWVRAGEPVDLSREGFGIRNGTDFEENNAYRDAKFWSRVQNYGVEYKNLPATERKVYLTQYMEEQLTGELSGIQTTYWKYRMELLAERKFEKLAEDVGHAGIYSGAELGWVDAERELLDIPNGSLDELIVCKITGEKGERLQILARKDDQLMEMKYKGSAEIEDILQEINQVFAAQAK